MATFLLRIYDYFRVHKPIFYALLVVLFVLLGLGSSRIGLEEDVSAILPDGTKAREITDILKSSSVADKVIVKIKGNNENPEVLIETASELEQRFSERFKEQIASIQSQVDDETTLNIYETVRNHLPVFLEEQDYQTIDSLTQAAQIPMTLNQDYEALTSASGMVVKKLVTDDPLGISIPVLRKLQTLQMSQAYELYDGYIFSKDGKSLYLFITLKNALSETAKNEKLFDRFDEEIENIKAKNKGIEVLYYGNAVVAAGNARQLKRDSIVTLSITIGALLIFIWFFFRRKRIPFVMMLPVVFGGIFSLAILALLRGNISTIALGAGSIVLGIAVNYSIHYFTHYNHCGSARQTLVDLLVPITLGSFTTVGSFLALTLLESKLLNDFGWFAGLSLIGAALFTLLFLPQLMPSPNQEMKLERKSWFSSDKISIAPGYRWVFPAIILLLTIFFFRYASDVKFESDLNTVNFMDDKTKKAQKEIDLTQDDTSKVVFIASIGKNTEEMLQNNERLQQQLKEAKEKGWIQDYSSLSSFIPSEKIQRERIDRWNKYWSPDKKQFILNELKIAGQKLKFTSDAFSNFDSTLRKEYHPITGSSFNAITEAFGKEFLIHRSGEEVVLNSVRVEKAERNTLYAELEKNASIVILDKQIITNNLVEVIMSDFNRILLYTSSLVFIALLFTYGRLELTIITFMPMVITWIWILGIMGLFGLQFNIINIIISTFIFGLGDDFGIFMTDGLIRKYKEGKEILHSHKTSIFLSAITILIGLGALVFAKHPALRSIAFISIIGIFSVVIIGQTIQPLLFNFFIQSRKDKGQAPWTLTTLALTWISFTYFSVSAILLTVFGYLLFLLPFVSRSRKKLIFHYLIHASIKSLAYMMANVPKQHINKETMDFSKPGIIIANHTSVLDILVTVMQNPRLILLTNRWVYYSPVFGKVVQMADYYPAMEGVNPALDKFEQVIKDGYSIVIFPEGTRSVDGSIKRFHKGAFLLAEKLKLDIIPLVIHGGADSLRKGDFMIFNGQMTMKYMPRITPDDNQFGEGYTARAKNLTSLFRKEYKKLQDEIETPAWFRQRLVMNYLYTGLNLEWQARKAARREKYFQILNDILPKEGMITEIGCGYGFTTYMMHFLGKDRKFIAVDSDEEKISVANHCYSKNQQLHFIHADVQTFEPEASDAILIHPKNISADGLEACLNRCMDKTTGPVLLIGQLDNKPSGYVLNHLDENIYEVKRNG